METVQKRVLFTKNQEPPDRNKESREDHEESQSGARVKEKVLFEKYGKIAGMEMSKVFRFNNEINKANEEICQLGQGINLKVLMHSILKPQATSLGKHHEIDRIRQDAEQTNCR